MGYLKEGERGHLIRNPNQLIHSGQHQLTIKWRNQIESEFYLCPNQSQDDRQPFSDLTKPKLNPNPVQIILNLHPDVQP